MDDSIFTISKDRLGSGGRIPIVKLGNAIEVFKTMALDMVQTIERNNDAGNQTVFIVPVGPVGQYPPFVDLVNSRNVSLKRVWFINMDEYLTDSDEYLSTSHRLSFRGFMDRIVYARIREELVMDASQRVFPDPADPGAVGRLIDHLGTVDVCYGGIGITGHVAFNEPEQVDLKTFAERSTRVLTISPETRTINAVGDLNGAVAAMPSRCITVGMREILAPRRIRLYCFRDWHRAVVRQAAYGNQSALFPVTLLQSHPDTTITVTDNVAEPCW